MQAKLGAHRLSVMLVTHSGCSSACQALHTRQQAVSTSASAAAAAAAAAQPPPQHNNAEQTQHQHPQMQQPPQQQDDRPPDDSSRAAARLAGQAYFDSVLARAEAGEDPFAHQQAPRAATAAAAAGAAAGAAGAGLPAAESNADIAAFAAWFESNKAAILCGLYVAAQGSAFVLMKGSLISMATPGVLTFLHLLAAALLQLLLVAYAVLPGPEVSAKSAKGAAVQAAISGLQLLLAMAVLCYASVYMLLAWTAVVPLLLGLSRAADVSSSNKALLKPVPQQLQAPLAAAAAGLVLELLADSHRGVLPLSLLLLWSATVVLQLLWKQVKVDATLGHRLMDPDCIVRCRELSDLEDALSPSSAALMAAALPALPALVLGLACLEGRDLVEHEPSVPTLSVLLLSCLAHAGANSLRVLLAAQLSAAPQLAGVLMGAAALLAVVLDFMERAHALGLACLLGVTLACGGSLAVHLTRWRGGGGDKLLQHTT